MAPSEWKLLIGAAAANILCILQIYLLFSSMYRDESDILTKPSSGWIICSGERRSSYHNWTIMCIKGMMMGIRNNKIRATMIDYKNDYNATPKHSHHSESSHICQSHHSEWRRCTCQHLSSFGPLLLTLTLPNNTNTMKIRG